MPVKVGSVVDGTVSGITNFGAFVELEDGKTGLVHISEVADDYVKNIHDYLQDKQKVKVKVLSVEENGKISLSIKQAEALNKKKEKPAEIDWTNFKNESSNLSFEDKISRFLKDSEEKMQAIKGKAKNNRRSNGYGNKKVSRMDY